MNFWNLREPVSALTHGAGLVLALLGTLLLWRRSRGANPIKRLSLVVFGLSLVCCYAASSLYHGLRIPEGRLAIFDRLDRVGIFILIAGTYTPLAWGLMSGWWRWATLAVAWLITIVASGTLMMVGPFSSFWTTGLYLGMGWSVVACYAELARVVSFRALRPLVAGGLFYSVGAVLNVLHWPVLWPSVFGAHELFHLFVIAGSVSHYRLMTKLVVPFETSPGEFAPGLGRGRRWFVPNAPGLQARAAD